MHNKNRRQFTAQMLTLTGGALIGAESFSGRGVR